MNPETIKKIAPLRILFVDDDKAVAESMGRFLSRICKEVRVSYDGENGHEVFSEFLPDIIISDITMPRLNGVEMSKRIRLTHPDTKIIFVTGHSDAVVDLVNENTACILKPIDSDSLMQAFEKFLG
jgi:two-component system, cell cycle response regulator